MTIQNIEFVKNANGVSLWCDGVEYPWSGSAPGSIVTLANNGDGTGILTIDGVPNDVCLTCGTDTDTFATLAGTVLGLPDGQTIDLAHTVDTDTFVTLNDNGDGTITGTNVDNTSVIFPTTDTDTFATIVDQGDGTSLATNADGVQVVLSNVDTDTDTFAVVTNNGDGTFSAVNADNSIVSWSGNPVTDTFATLTGTILMLPDGQTFDLAHTVDTDTFATIEDDGNGNFTGTNADGTVVNWSETVDTFGTFVENANDYTWTSADGATTVTIPKSVHTTAVDGNDGTMTITDPENDACAVPTVLIQNKAGDAVKGDTVNALQSSDFVAGVDADGDMDLVVNGTTCKMSVRPTFGTTTATITGAIPAVVPSEPASPPAEIKKHHTHCEYYPESCCMVEYATHDSGTAWIAKPPVMTKGCLPPITSDDGVFTVVAGMTSTIDIGANDIAQDGAIDWATVVITNLPAGWTAVNNNDGTFDITPDGGAVAGDYEFNYTVSDAEVDGSNESTVRLLIENVSNFFLDGDGTETNNSADITANLALGETYGITDGSGTAIALINAPAGYTGALPTFADTDAWAVANGRTTNGTNSLTDALGNVPVCFQEVDQCALQPETPQQSASFAFGPDDPTGNPGNVGDVRHLIATIGDWESQLYLHPVDGDGRSGPGLVEFTGGGQIRVRGSLSETVAVTATNPEGGIHFHRLEVFPFSYTGTDACQSQITQVEHVASDIDGHDDPINVPAGVAFPSVTALTPVASGAGMIISPPSIVPDFAETSSDVFEATGSDGVPKDGQVVWDVDIGASVYNYFGKTTLEDAWNWNIRATERPAAVATVVCGEVVSAVDSNGNVITDLSTVELVD